MTRPPAEHRVTRRRRARWPWVLVAVVIVLAGLVVGGEFVARAMVAQQVRSQVISALALPADQQLDVTVDGIVLPQLIAGRLDGLHISSKRVALGPITGAVSVDAAGVPIRGGDLRSATGTIRIDAAQLETIVKSTSMPVDTVTLEGKDVKASGTATVLGAAVPLSVTLTPGAEGGELTLTPTSVSIGSVTLDPSDDSSPFARVLKPVFSTQKVCIADRLPAGVHLSGLRVDGDSLLASFAADGAITADRRLQALGSCP
ncbi:LmeA family phospholipid-binding protein [Microbacterium sp. 22242]|uniref:LmeA family phospholipid-binding protein n=1 Tax=Microbacterium sp. 22242 TaxID=3453896 RepID=UPI003F843B5A